MLRYLGALVLVVGLVAPAFAYADTTDVRLRVVFYPALIVAPTDAKNTPPRFTVDQVQADLLNAVSETITSTHPLYLACFYNLAKPAPDCDPTTANVLITTQFTPDPKSKDPAHPDWIVSMRSLDMINGRIVTTLALGPLTEAALTASGASPVHTALKALVPKPDQVSALIGTAAIRNNRLSLFQGYEPYVQLVPTLADSNQPTYLSLMANLLDRRGLPSVPSQFNAGVVASGTTPLDAICGRGQRYLVYGLSSEEFTHQVSLSTRIQTHASAQLYDCTTMTVIPVGLDQHVSVLTTKGPLSSFLTIIQTAFFWQSKTVSPVPLNVIGLVSPFVDAVPGSDPVKHSVADRALQGLVDRLCAKLDEVPAPAPAPAAAPLLVRVAAAPRQSAKISTLHKRVQQAKLARDKAADELQSAKDDNAKKAARKAFNKWSDAYDKAVSDLTLAATGSDTGAGFVDKAQVASPPATAAGQPAAQAGTALVALDVSGFVSASPPPLKCNPDTKLDRWSGTPADPTRWQGP